LLDVAGLLRIKERVKCKEFVEDQVHLTMGATKFDPTAKTASVTGMPKNSLTSTVKS